MAFVQMTEPAWGSVEPLPSDPMNSFKFECDSRDVFYFTGAAIYNVQGDEEGFLVESQRWTRLWAWDGGKPKQSWRISRPGGQLTLTDKLILSREGDHFTMYCRKSGREQGPFYIE